MHLSLWCPASARLSSWPTTLCHVYNPTQYSPLISVLKSPPLFLLVNLITLLFLSFHPSKFQSNITHLQNALQQISSSVTANLITLNSSKTEFLLVGLKQQLSKIHDYSACNHGFIFDETLPFQTKSLHFLNPATITFVNFAVSAHISTSKQSALLPLLLSIIIIIIIVIIIRPLSRIFLENKSG